jgi:hypothetical protein
LPCWRSAGAIAERNKSFAGGGRSARREMTRLWSVWQSLRGKEAEKNEKGEQHNERKHYAGGTLGSGGIAADAFDRASR